MTVAERDLVAVLHRVVRVLGLGRRVDAHRDAVLEREAAVPGDVIGVRVRLDVAHDADVEPLGLLEVLLDREGGIDDDRRRRPPRIPTRYDAQPRSSFNELRGRSRRRR